MCMYGREKTAALMRNANDVGGSEERLSRSRLFLLLFPYARVLAENMKSHRPKRERERKSAEVRGGEQGREEDACKRRVIPCLTLQTFNRCHRTTNFSPPYFPGDQIATYCSTSATRFEINLNPPQIVHYVIDRPRRARDTAYPCIRY